MSDRPTIFLVHGAFEDSSVWGPVVQHLTQAGFQVVAIDLPGRGGDATPKAAITQATYRDAILTQVTTAPSPVVLVGHSFGGITISTVAEAAPEAIKALVYVAAFLPKDGDSQQTLAMTDTESKLGPALVIDVANMVASVQRDQRTPIFLNDGTAAQQAGFEDTFVDEPLQPPGTPVHLTAARFGTVRKAYVHTTRDLAVGYRLQQTMAADAGVTEIHRLDSGHTPFITHPQELAAIIAAIASR